MQKAGPWQGANGQPLLLEEELEDVAGLVWKRFEAAILQLGRFAGGRFKRAKEAPSGRRIFGSFSCICIARILLLYFRLHSVRPDVLIGWIRLHRGAAKLLCLGNPRTRRLINEHKSASAGQPPQPTPPHTPQPLPAQASVYGWAWFGFNGSWLAAFVCTQATNLIT